MDDQIADRGSRHVEAERLPVVAVIERDVDRSLGAREEQPLADRIFADGIDGSIIRQSAYDFLPSFAVVMRAIDMRSLVIQPDAIDGGVGGGGVKSAGIDHGYLAP